MKAPGHRCLRGFSLVELLVVVALAAVVLAIGVPSYKDYIIVNRLKAVNSQLVADLQFARSEAAARNLPVYWSARGTGTLSCYTIFTVQPGFEGAECNCALGPDLACGSSTLTHIKTVQVPFSGKVRYTIPGSRMFAFDNVNGGVYYGTTDFADPTFTDFVVNTIVIGDASRTLQTRVSPAGRPTVCSAGAKHISGYTVC